MQGRKKKLFHGLGRGQEQKIEPLFILRANSSADLLHSYTTENQQPFLRPSHLGARLGKGEVWGFQLGIPHYCRGLVPQAIIFSKLRIHYQDIIILATKRRTGKKKAPIFLLISTRFNDNNGLGLLKFSDAGGQQGCPFVLLTDEEDSAARRAAYLAISLCSSSSRFELSSIL